MVYLCIGTLLESLIFLALLGMEGIKEIEGIMIVILIALAIVLGINAVVLGY